jgi:hypothetical protein
MFEPQRCGRRKLPPQGDRPHMKYVLFTSSSPCTLQAHAASAMIAATGLAFAIVS